MPLAFQPGDRVRVSDGYHWARGVFGTVLEPPESLRQVAHGWIGWRREIESRQGTLTFYYVEFDEPRDDGSGDGPYRGGEIDARFLGPAT